MLRCFLGIVSGRLKFQFRSSSMIFLRQNLFQSQNRCLLHRSQGHDPGFTLSQGHRTTTTILSHTITISHSSRIVRHRTITRSQSLSRIVRLTTITSQSPDLTTTGQKLSPNMTTITARSSNRVLDQITTISLNKGHMMMIDQNQDLKDQNRDLSHDLNLGLNNLKSNQFCRNQSLSCRLHSQSNLNHNLSQNLRSLIRLHRSHNQNQNHSHNLNLCWSILPYQFGLRIGEVTNDLCSLH